ncbi:hypothetical protein NMY22_g11505 [Coprinellus aureogranulatus]|nr:hypothetical protein NMY22_g11505 [Coprinellus aureogranulatus]
MPYEHLLCDLWATSPAVLGEDTSFLAELVYGHLIHHFSTPASFMTWDENIPHRIQKLLRTVADNFPQVKPTSAIRTLLVVLSVKKDAPGAVAFNDDIELLYMMAFKHIAGFYDYAFTPSVFDVLTDLRYVGTKMDHYPSYLKHHLDQSLHNDHRPKVDAKIIDFLKFYLAPFLPAYVEGRVDESPEMPAFVDLKRLEPARGKQTLVFPDSMRKLTPLSPVVEEEPATPESSIAFFDVVLYEATPKGTVADKEVNALVDSETSSSFATTVDMSLLDDPFDEESLASSSSSATSSLTIVSTVAAGSGESPLPSTSNFSGSSRLFLLPFSGESKLCEELEPAILATVAPDRGTSEMVGSPSSATASSMLPPPLRGGSLSHNPASQLNAVFSVPESHPIAKDVAKHPSSGLWFLHSSFVSC